MTESMSTKRRGNGDPRTLRRREAGPSAGRTDELRIKRERLMARLDALAAVGALGGGGVCRLALTDEDRLGRDLVVSMMRDLGLAVTIDSIGNVVGIRSGAADAPPVMTGSHIDTVRTGGRYDGALGVLAGLEVVATLDEAAITTRCPLAVAFFTNEEGARFPPDMMGSMVHQGHLGLAEALSARGIDGTTVEENLRRIGYAGRDRATTAAAYLELHIEQGPVLESEGITIGAVEGVQGISWTGVEIEGVANHAGTTPMGMRRDAGYAAAAVTTYARELARELGGDQVATVGRLDLTPNLVNVIAAGARLSVDLRNTDCERLRTAEESLYRFLADLGRTEQVDITHRSLARYEPVRFDPSMVALVERHAERLGQRVRRLASGAGHDAQAFAPNCPTGMIFVPSERGISHNVEEHTDPADIEAGANVLLHALLELCG